MCEGAMQCNGMPGGVEMPSSSRGHYVSGFSKQCMHLKQARNNARQETSQGSNLEKSSEVYFTQEGALLRGDVPTVLPCLPCNGWRPRQRSKGHLRASTHCA